MPKLETIIKARYLRQEDTKAEQILWQKLRGRKLEVKFRRQHPIDMFILDFYAPEIKLAIELDGNHHKESKEYDEMRTKYIETKNIKVIRFWNYEIEKNLEDVMRKVKNEIQNHLTPARR